MNQSKENIGNYTDDLQRLIPTSLQSKNINVLIISLLRVARVIEGHNLVSHATIIITVVISFSKLRIVRHCSYSNYNAAQIVVPRKVPDPKTLKFRIDL